MDSNFKSDKVNYEKRGYDESKKETLTKTYEEKNSKPANNFDFGITAGLGLELHIKPIGRFQIEGRFYYGLGNIYGDSKSDCFSRSAHQTIILRGAYLIDI